MTNITSLSLEAAILDQKVAGAFHGKTYCFVAIWGNGGHHLGVAVANEQGYNPIVGKTFADRKEADEWARQLNAHIGRSDEEATRIVISTMGGKRYEAAA
jgi:hypothetical protein